MSFGYSGRLNLVKSFKKKIGKSNRFIKDKTSV